MGFDEDRRRGERDRLQAAAERAAARDGADDHSIAGDRFSSLVLHLVLGVGAGAAGLAIALVGVLGAWPLLLVPMGLVLSLAGVAVVARGTLTQGRRLRLVAPSTDPRLRSAFETARDATSGASALAEDQRIELLAALQGGYDEVLRQESARPGLLAAIRNLPPDGGGEVGGRLHAALDDLDRHRDEFVGRCGQLQATVATMALRGDRGAALDELAGLTARLGSQASADGEIDDAIAAARTSKRQGTT